MIYWTSTPYIKKEQREQQKVELLSEIPDEALLMSLPDDSIIIEFDEPCPDTKEAIEVCIKKFALEPKYHVRHTSHNGFSDYLRIEKIKGLAELSDEERKKYRLAFYDKYVPSQYRQYVDESFTGSFRWIPIIGKEHWKKVHKPDDKKDYSKYTKVRVVHEIHIECENKIEPDLLHVAKKKATTKLTTVTKETASQCAFLDYAINNKLPEGQRNKIVSKNLAIYVYDKPNRDELIKRYCEVQNMQIGEIEGWINQFEEKKITEMNCKELKKYCEKNNIQNLCGDCKNDVFLAKAYGKITDLKYKTEHMQNFEVLKKATAIFGNEYIPALKLRWYQLVGNSLKKKLIKLGGITHDTRVHCVFAIYSGKGKKNLKLVTDRIANIRGFKSEKPTSLHAEQLVGKVIKQRKKVLNEKTGKYRTEELCVPNNGYLDSDFFTYDEGYLLMTGKDPVIQEARNYFCIATDPIGENLISKKLIDHAGKDRIEYFSETNVSLFTQPLPFDATTITTGFARRFLYAIIQDETSPELIFQQRLKSDGNMMHYCYVFADYLKEVEKNESAWQWSDECAELYNQYLLALINLGRNHSEQGYYYTNVMEQTLGDLLIKFSCILAGSVGTNIISKEHVELAYMDLVECFTNALDFVDFFVYGRIDYSRTWKTSDSKVEQCLEWLYERGAVNEASSEVTIKEFKDQIMHIFEFSYDDARNKCPGAEKKYLKLIKQQLIVAKREGQHSSKVWLAFNPNIQSNTSNTHNPKGLEYEKLYFDVINHFFILKDYVLPVLLVLPSNSEVASDSVLAKEETVGLVKLDDNVYHKCAECGSNPCRFQKDNKYYCSEKCAGGEEKLNV